MEYLFSSQVVHLKGFGLILFPSNPHTQTSWKNSLVILIMNNLSLYTILED
jgi:hypothetical protein